MIGHHVRRALALRRDEQLGDFEYFLRQQRARIKARLSIPSHAELNAVWQDVERLHGVPVLPREQFELVVRQ